MDDTVTNYLEAASEWLCDGYSLDVRYIAGRKGDGYELWHASVRLAPLPAPRDNNLHLVVEHIVAGQLQLNSIDKNAALALLENAVGAKLNAHGADFNLPLDGPLRAQSTISQRDLWLAPLELQIIGGPPTTLKPDVLAAIDHSLRTSTPPFDGLADLASWLGIRNPEYGHEHSTINITVSPPVAIIFDRCRLSGNRFTVTLHAHPGLNVEDIGLAVRFSPDASLSGRSQVANRIIWGDVHDMRREGVAHVEDAIGDSVLVMLMLGRSTIQRQWFLDPDRAANQRLLVVQQFDRDLRMIKAGLFDSSDSVRFELAVGALLFLLGFSAAVQLETDSPDLVVTTPTQRLVLVECTLRVADIATKVGKLVDRRGIIARAFEAGNHAGDVTAVLVCRQPKNQIAAHATLIQANGIILIAAEELSRAIERARFPADPDAMLSEARQSLAIPNPDG